MKKIKDTDLLHQDIEKIATLMPSKIAIITQNKHLTYGEIDKKADQVAQELKKHVIYPDHLIAIIMKKGWEQIVAVLSILKAGAAYLPIDPNEPTERIAHLLRACEVQWVLSQSELIDSLSWIEMAQLIDINHLLSLETKAKLKRINHSTSAQNLSYVIFTSGSTGTPKGVMIEHHSAKNTIQDINSRFEINASDKIFALSALNFDLSVYDIFGLLSVGGTLIMPNECDSKEPTHWDELFFHHEVTIWNSVPSLMDMFIEHVQYKYGTHTPSHQLRLVLLSGDWIPMRLPEKIWNTFGRQVKIISLGGATEASIWSIFHPIEHIDPSWESIPYGTPLKNQFFYILDKELNEVKGKRSGEICIGGLGLARGYWQDNKKTVKQFIAHPQFGRLYKTGDLGCYLPDGNIKFLGRIDHQVKIHGHRIELGAIETCLSKYPALSNAIVLAEGNDQRRILVAYLVLNTDYIKQQLQSSASSLKEQAQHWHFVHTNLYQDSQVEDPLLNTTGWISSYTGLPLDKKEMLEWVNNTVSLLSELNPSNILEIGCGTGMLLFRLASQTSEYHAMDFSESALNFLKEELKQKNLDHVKLFQREAINLPMHYRHYSLVILNSVVQYFPDKHYFMTVLKKAIDATVDGGYLFIGDIRSLQHLQTFFSSVLLDKVIPNISTAEWEALINRRIEEEEELVIDHEFFYHLPHLFPRISLVKVFLKPDHALNEMTRFRYNVLLHIGKHPHQKEIIPIKEMEWNKDLDFNLLISHLEEENTAVCHVKNIPNKRVRGYLAYNEIPSHHGWLSEFQMKLADLQSQSIDPDFVYDLNKHSLFDIALLWSIDHPQEYFDILVIKKELRKYPEKLNAIYLSLQQNYIHKKSFFSPHFNEPIRSRFNKQLHHHLKQYLKSSLPGYMIPHVFIHLPSLPVSRNGKIDRKSLPRASVLLTQVGKLALPKTETEKKLTQLWIDALGIPYVGIQDHYYELGGTSLIAVHLLAEIEKTFMISLSLNDLLIKMPTIAEIAKLIDNQKESSTLFQEGQGVQNEN